MTCKVPNSRFFFCLFLFLAALGLPCCVRAFSSCSECAWRLSSCGVLASPFGGFSLWSVASSEDSVVVAHGLSCHVACGIFLDQESNLCFLWWQADS